MRPRRGRAGTRNTLKAWLAFAQSRRSSRYRFELEECRLYLRERTWRTPPVVVREELEGVLCLEVEGRRLFWPQAFARDGLGWLYAEVFYPWEINPSSYAHPNAAVPRGGWVVDAGACEGFFSMYALESGAGVVLAVEPVSALQAALRRTFESECDKGRLQVFSGGLADRSGTVRMDCDEAHIWDSSMAAGDVGATGGESVVVSLDELVASWNPTGAGLVKMDIEGGEMAALTGASQTLKERRPKLAVAVYHGFDNAALCRELILEANSQYHIEFRGMYGWVDPPRPYLLFAW